MDGIKDHSAFRGLFQSTRLHRGHCTGFDLRGVQVAPQRRHAHSIIPSFCAMVFLAFHQYPPTSSVHVGSFSPGSLSKRYATLPCFQYATRCELILPPSQNFFASARFLAIICFTVSSLHLDDFNVFLLTIGHDRGARFRGGRAG